MSAERRLTDDEYTVLARAYLTGEPVPRPLVEEVAPLTFGEMLMLQVVIQEMTGAIE